MSRRAALAVCVFGGVLAASGRAENWPQWRGPLFNGSSPERDLPVKFSPTENVTWSADMPGVGGSSPIIYDDHVFICAMHPQTMKTYALCLNRDDGKVRWQHEIGSGFANRMGNNAASGSPVTDGKGVWFFYGTGEMIAYDMDGRRLWQRNIQRDHGRFEMMWGFGATPLLHKGKLYLPVLHGDHRSRNPARSYLLCIDPKTGKDLWKRWRDTDARAESKQAYTTPIPMDGPKGPRILLVGGDCISAHDPDNGREIWRSDSYNPRRDRWWRVVPSPVVADGVVVGCAPKGGEILAVKTGRSGQLTAKDRAWTAYRNSPDVCTPLAYRGRLFVLDGRAKAMVCMAPKTGEVVWKGRLGGRSVFQASPTGADGKIYCMNMSGQVIVLSAGGKLEVLHRADMGGRGVRSSVAAAGGQLFIRTSEKLYCIGKRR